MSVPYLHRAVIIVPASMADLSARIGRVLDPDSGGDMSFASILASKAGTAYQVCDVAIIEQTRNTYQAMLDNPALLAGAVAAGWVRRQLDGEPPNAQQCTDWLAASTIWLGDAWAVTAVPCWDILAGLGYTYVPPAPPEGLP